MNIQKIKIELLQGENQPLVFCTEISSVRLSKISGTLAFRIITLMQKAKKYKMNLGGFSFARKFDVRISMNEVSASGTEDLGLSSVQFGITLQANESSVDKFHGFIADLVNAIATGEGQIEDTFVNLKEELCLN
jgi:hypothetical protein